MADYIDFPGHAGTYRYFFLNSLSKATIKPFAGNYMFLKPTAQGWVPVYAGIADDLSSRLPNHEMAPAAYAAGATQVVAHLNPDHSARKAEERDLIGYWNPTCNTQHRTALGSVLGL